MKGLQAALRDREERHCRVDRRIIDEEKIEENSRVLLRLKKGTRVTVEHYCRFHDVTRQGTVTELSKIYAYVAIDGERIYFDDIYDIKIDDN